MIVAAASGSVGETIAPSTNAASQGRSGISSCAAQATAAHRHQHEPDGGQRERAQAGAQVVDVGVDRRGVEERRQEDDEHHLGIELHLRQARDEPDQRAADDEHDRIRDRHQARERAQAGDGDQQPGDEDLGLAHRG
jgi:hypothetical protein